MSDLTQEGSRQCAICMCSLFYFILFFYYFIYLFIYLFLFFSFFGRTLYFLTDKFTSLEDHCIIKETCCTLKPSRIHANDSEKRVSSSWPRIRNPVHPRPNSLLSGFRNETWRLAFWSLVDWMSVGFCRQQQIPIFFFFFFFFLGLLSIFFRLLSVPYTDILYGHIYTSMPYDNWEHPFMDLSARMERIYNVSISPVFLSKWPSKSGNGLFSRLLCAVPFLPFFVCLFTCSTLAPQEISFLRLLLLFLFTPISQ